MPDTGKTPQDSDSAHEDPRRPDLRRWLRAWWPGIVAIIGGLIICVAMILFVLFLWAD